MIWKKDVLLSIPRWQTTSDLIAWKQQSLFWSWICSSSRAWLHAVSCGAVWNWSWITWKPASSLLSGGWHWPMASTWNTYMWSLHVFSALPHGMVIRFRKSPSQEKLADAACPFLIKPLKSHSITFAALWLRQPLSPACI